MEELLASYGPRLGLVLWVLSGTVGLFVVLVKQLIPNMVAWRQKARDDQQEHRQKLEKEAFDMDKLQTLTAMGSQSFSQEQITTLTAETIDLLRDVIEWMKGTLTDRIKGLEDQLDENQATFQQTSEHTLSQIMRLDIAVDDLTQRFSLIETALIEDTLTKREADEDDGRSKSHEENSITTS